MLWWQSVDVTTLLPQDGSLRLIACKLWTPSSKMARKDFDPDDGGNGFSDQPLPARASFDRFKTVCLHRYRTASDTLVFDTFDSFSALFLVLLGLLIPFILLVWTMLQQLTGIGGEVSPVRWLLAMMVPLVMSAGALKRKSLNRSGAFAAYIVGFLMMMSSYVFAASVIVFFVVCSKATRIKANMKRLIEADYQEGGQRNWVQVFCNGGVATLYSVLYMLEAGCHEKAVDFSSAYYESCYALSVLGALACTCGDTLASELGSVYSRSNPRLITTLRQVPRGTNGAVSKTGLVASAAGGLLMGLMFYFLTLFCLTTHAVESSPPQWPLIPLGAFLGLLGSGVDSYLGAMFQFSGLDETNRAVNHAGEGIKKTAGLNLLDNHTVNFLSCLVTALMAPKVGLHVWSYLT